MMRRFLSIALACLLAVSGPSSAQMTLTGAGSSKAVASGGGTTTFDPVNIGSNLVPSNGNLTVTMASNGGTSYRLARSIANHSSGKYYAEITIGNDSGLANYLQVGTGNNSALTSATYIGGDANSLGCFNTTAACYISGASSQTGAPYTTSNVVSIAVDLTNRNFWYAVNGGSWNNDGTANPATNTGGFSISAVTGAAYLYVSLHDDLTVPFPTMTANFGATSYSFTAPTGYGNW